MSTAEQLLALANVSQDKINTLGRAAASCHQIHRVLLEMPIATVSKLCEKTSLSPATVNKSLGHLEQLTIVTELTAQKRNRVFSYARYIEIMNEGTELPGR